MTKEKAPIKHRSDNDQYTLNAVVVSKTQLEKYLGISRYKLNKNIMTPELRQKMGLSKEEYNRKQEFTPEEFRIIRKHLLFTDDEVRALIDLPK